MPRKPIGREPTLAARVGGKMAVYWMDFRWYSGVDRRFLTLREVFVLLRRGVPFVALGPEGEDVTEELTRSALARAVRCGDLATSIVLELARVAARAA